MLEDHKVNEVEKLKKFLIEIMLNPEWTDNYEEYKYYYKYKKHMTYAGLVHTYRYIKYKTSKFDPNIKYALTAKGKKWLDKQQKGELNEQ